MKSSIMQHFIGFYTICKYKNNLQRKKYNFYSDIITFDPSVYFLDLLMFIVSKQNEESIKG